MYVLSNIYSLSHSCTLSFSTVQYVPLTQLLGIGNSRRFVLLMPTSNQQDYSLASVYRWVYKYTPLQLMRYRGKRPINQWKGILPFRAKLSYPHLSSFWLLLSQLSAQFTIPLSQLSDVHFYQFVSSEQVFFYWGETHLSRFQSFDVCITAAKELLTHCANSSLINERGWVGQCYQKKDRNVPLRTK